MNKAIRKSELPKTDVNFQELTDAQSRFVDTLKNALNKLPNIE
jgi:hypothetical protein